ncbi:hypothetical protein LXL04_020432 [Taraxacum kok-saghyz]
MFWRVPKSVFFKGITVWEIYGIVGVLGFAFHLLLRRSHQSPERTPRNRKQAANPRAAHTGTEGDSGESFPEGRYWFLNVEIRWSPKGDISYLQKFFLTYVGGRAPLHLQEDLCGTALLSTEWLRSDSRRTAVGLDLDVEALDWCMENNVNKVGADLSECELRMQRRFPNFTYTWEQAGFYILQRKARIGLHFIRGTRAMRRRQFYSANGFVLGNRATDRFLLFFEGCKIQLAPTYTGNI